MMGCHDRLHFFDDGIREGVNDGGDSRKLGDHMNFIQEVVHRINEERSKIRQIDKVVGAIETILDNRVRREASPHIVHGQDFAVVPSIFPFQIATELIDALLNDWGMLSSFTGRKERIQRRSSHPMGLVFGCCEHGQRMLVR